MNDKEYALKAARFARTERWRAESHRLVTCMGIWEQQKVLDFGCNTGRLTNLIAAYTGMEGAFGVDINLEAIRMARATYPRGKFTYGSPYDYAAKSFDAIVVSHAVAHIRKPRVTLPLLKRLLKTDGKMGIITPNRVFYDMMIPKNWFTGYKRDSTIRTWYTRKTLKKLLESTGFKVTKSYYDGEYVHGLGWTKIQCLRSRLIMVVERS